MDNKKIKDLIFAASGKTVHELKSVETSWVEVGAEKVPHETVKIVFSETKEADDWVSTDLVEWEPESMPHLKTSYYAGYNQALNDAKNCKTLDQVKSLVEMKSL